MIRDDLADAIRRELAALGVEPHEVTLERPSRLEHGDWSTNAALVHAKAAGRNQELAQSLADNLEAAPPEHVERVEIAGPGFVNVHLRDTWLHEVLRDVVAAGEDYGRRAIAEGTKVNVEFVSGAPPARSMRATATTPPTATRSPPLRALRLPGGARVLPQRQGTQMDLYARSLAARKAGEDVPEDRYRR